MKITSRRNTTITGRLPWAVLVVGWFVAACSEQNPDQPGSSKPPNAAQAVQPKPQQDPLADMARAVAVAKSSAEVELSYEIIGKPVFGEPVKVRLFFVPTVDAQVLSAEITAAQPLTLSGVLKPIFSDLKLGQINEHEFSALLPPDAAEGIYLANVAASLTRAGKPNTKVFAIPLAFTQPQPVAEAQKPTNVAAQK